VQALALIGSNEFSLRPLKVPSWHQRRLCYSDIAANRMNMIPQIAHHPRHLSQQFGSPGFATLPFEPLPTPRRPDRLAPLPFRSSRNLTASSPLAPPQRAYPAENYGAPRPSLVRGSSAGQGFTGQYDDPSEHMLRRKTPNGTLAAGYDGTPVQWSSKAPALKHVVLPMTGTSNGQNGGYSSSATDDPRNRQKPGRSGWHYQQPATQTGGFNILDGEMCMSSDPVNWTLLPPMSDHSQNVWDHIRTKEAITFYPNNDIQIPTVLQPAYQPSPGPTASNDGGLYGPYWPDGKFVPYRPAAFREQGHYHPNHGYDFNRGLDQYSQTPTEQLPPFRQPSFSSHFLQRSGNASLSSLDSLPRYPEDRFSILSQSHSSLPNTTAYPSISDGSRTPTAQSTNRAGNTRFKEKTLSWAHGIYVDLLAFLHQSRKANRQSRQSHGLRTYSKNSIYPKPPRQPASSYMGSSNWGEFDSDESRGPISRSNIGSLLVSPDRTTGSNNLTAWQGAHGQVEPRHPGRPSNQDIPHYISPFQISHPHASSPLSKAKEALEMLTTLCDQSGWGWIDGMLLGGCLAYGLEEYHKALDWYSKIIALDPK
jgi:hypothetical protein